MSKNIKNIGKLTFLKRGYQKHIFSNLLGPTVWKMYQKPKENCHFCFHMIKNVLFFSMFLGLTCPRLACLPPCSLHLSAVSPCWTFGAKAIYTKLPIHRHRAALLQTVSNWYLMFVWRRSQRTVKLWHPCVVALVRKFSWLTPHAADPFWAKLFDSC